MLVLRDHHLNNPVAFGDLVFYGALDSARPTSILADGFCLMLACARRASQLKKRLLLCNPAFA